MDLIPYFLGLRLVLNERHHGLEFVRAPSLESRRIVEDEPWVALEGKFITNVVDPSLWHQISFMITELHKDHRVGTSSVGLICRKKMIRRYQAKLVAYPIINWILPCIADPLEQRRFPAFALPITRMWKWVYLARILAMSCLWGVLCDPSLKTFFIRLTNSLDFLAI